MLNFFKRDNKENFKEVEQYKSVSNITKVHYDEFINSGTSFDIKRAGISFPSNLHDFLKIFSKYEDLTVSKLVVDMVMFVLEDKDRFNEFLKSKYGKKL